MRGLRSVIFVVIFFIIAGLIGYGAEKVCVALLPSDFVGTLVRVYDVGVHCLSLNVNICGIIGLIASYAIVTYVVKK